MISLPTATTSDGDVEMGVPIDRGLTHCAQIYVHSSVFLVEMGVPIDRGLTPSTRASAASLCIL